MNNNLSENLKKIRKDNNLSQEQFAEILGVSRQAISKWESSTAYPEMEKLIQISKRFEINIDDLLNGDIREIKGEEKTKKDINKHIDSILNYITDTINLFSNMTFTSKIKCLFEQFVICIILFIIISTIGMIGRTILNSILNFLPFQTHNYICGIFSSIFIVIMFFISAVILLHTFKTRYLDYYKEIKIDNNEQVNEEVKENKKIKDNKIIIRDPKHTEYKFINGIFKIILLGIKAFAIFILMFLCFTLLFLVIGTVLTFIISKTGLFFIGLLLSGLSCCSINVIFILVLLNFIFTRKNDKKKIIWTFIISVLTLGIGLGLITVGTLSFNYKDINEQSMKKEVLKIDMNNELFIHKNYEVEIIEKEIDNIEIEYDINKAFYGTYSITEDGLFIYTNCDNPFKVIRQVLKDINNKELYSLESDIYNIKVYANSENKRILEENYNNYINRLDNEE